MVRISRSQMRSQCLSRPFRNITMATRSRYHAVISIPICQKTRMKTSFLGEGRQVLDLDDNGCVPCQRRKGRAAQLHKC